MGMEHLENKIEEGIDCGLSPEAVRRAAMRAMDGLEQRKEEIRDMRRVITCLRGTACSPSRAQSRRGANRIMELGLKTYRRIGRLNWQ
jgi:hypothetical protein